MNYIRTAAVLCFLMVASTVQAYSFSDSIKALPARKAASGIIITGSGSSVRAFEPFHGTAANGKAYAAMINHYADTLGGKVRVYSMVIPTAAAFYCPDTARAWTNDEAAAIDNIHANLSASVRFVDIFNELKAHVSEPEYLRTDHHWAPLAAYYAAAKFAETAGVPFKSLACYDTLVVHDFVGTMYKFSKDISVRRAPEDFVYYVPRDIDCKATFIKYTLARGGKVAVESEPVDGDFFIHYKDGNGAAYCTFMGGDTRTVSFKTSCGNGRRLLVVKDSYGNALPGYMFFSFDEVHVIDFRYYNKNILKYISNNGITDLLFANNLLHAHARSTARLCQELLKK